MTFRDILEIQLKKHEGFRPTIYKDTVGKWTIGYGRNLSDGGITIDEASVLLENDMGKAITAAEGIFDNFDTLNDQRKAVVANMAFNIGAGGLRQFVKFIKAVNDGDFNTAAVEMLNSRWAKQVGIRAIELADIMRNGL